MAPEDDSQVTSGEGYAVAGLDDLGQGPGFRKVRRGLGVTAFGVNAIVIPPGYDAGSHYHEEQEELYFVHRGTLAMRFGDGSEHILEEGSFARVDPSTLRGFRNPGESDVVILVVGGKDGYVGRDGKAPDDPAERPPGR
jgi:quercetin dioxygenase-like cupin family protein